MPQTAKYNGVPGCPRVEVVSISGTHARVRSDEAEPGHEELTVPLAELSSFEGEADRLPISSSRAPAVSCPNCSSEDVSVVEAGDWKGHYECAKCGRRFNRGDADAELVVPEDQAVAEADASLAPPAIEEDAPDNPRDNTAAGVMSIVHEEAEAQNGWDVLGVSFIGLDLETGIVRFRHSAGEYGTAFFRWHPGVKGDRVLFDHGHYGCDWPTSARDFCERLRREA